MLLRAEKLGQHDGTCGKPQEKLGANTSRLLMSSGYSSAPGASAGALQSSLSQEGKAARLQLRRTETQGKQIAPARLPSAGREAQGSSPSHLAAESSMDNPESWPAPRGKGHTRYTEAASLEPELQVMDSEDSLSLTHQADGFRMVPHDHT